MTRIACLFGLLILSLSYPIMASTLSYSVEGVGGSLARNITAWLGDQPETIQERSNFLAVLDERVEKSLQALGYYRADIEVQIDNTRPQWLLTISVVANDPVRISSVDIRLVGDASQNPRFVTLQADSGLVVGDKFNHDTYEHFKRRTLSLGQRLGFFDGKFTVQGVRVDPARATAEVELEYVSGVRHRFGSLQYDSEQFDISVIDTLRTFHAGQYFDLALLQQFQAQLQQTGFFSSVVVRPLLQGISEQRVPIVLQLSPVQRHHFDVGVGFSTDTQERVSMTWRSPNLNRFGHSQETRFEYSQINPSGTLRYNIPLTHPLNDQLQLTARVEDNEFGDIDSQQREVGVRRELRATDGWISSYFLRALNESWEVVGLRTDNDYMLPGFTLSHRRRTGLMVDPSAGFSQLYRLEGASDQLASDINLLRVYGQFAYITTLAPKHRIVARAEFGAVLIDEDDRGDLAPSLGFFAGGSQSIRGFGYQSIGNEVSLLTRQGTPTSLTIGGDRLITSSLEYQYYLNDTWRGALFVDAGDAFDEGEFDLHYGLGFGIHYLSPVGAIKIELANSASDDDPAWRVHINIGAEF